MLHYDLALGKVYAIVLVAGHYSALPLFENT